jgi:hypothetical protein
VPFPSPWSTLPATTSKLRSGRWCRFLTYPPSKPTSNFLAGLVDEEEAEHFRRLLQPFAHLHRPVSTVLAVVWEDKGKSSPRKSATFPNGNNAAILAVRYRNSGVVGFLFVKSAEKLRACDPEQEHPLSRRIRMPTFPYTSPVCVETALWTPHLSVWSGRVEECDVLTRILTSTLLLYAAGFLTGQVLFPYL